MTSPSAQKAAGEIFTKANIELPDASGYRYDTEIAASIIQQAITEAVDAAVAQERERYRKLVAEWRMRVSDASTGDSAELFCASELEVLMGDK